MSLFVTFGPPLSDDGPLLNALECLVGKIVQVRVSAPGGEQQQVVTGTLLRAESEDLPALLGYVVRLVLQCGVARQEVEIPTDRCGSAAWDCPRLRRLTVTAGDERVFVIADAREIRKLDEIEDALQGGLALDDPVQRHERLEAVVARAWALGCEADDPELRMRLSGLTLFLTDYWPPRGSPAIV